MSDNRAKLIKLSVGLPFGLGNAEWEADRTEQQTAWAIYVELVTRISVEPLPNDQGLDREALTSLYELFKATREILKSAGPRVGAESGSVGNVALGVLKRGLRPFLQEWHPELLDWEAQREATVSKRAHERNWPRHQEFRTALAGLQEQLRLYSNVLRQASGVKSTP